MQSIQEYLQSIGFISNGETFVRGSVVIPFAAISGHTLDSFRRKAIDQDWIQVEEVHGVGWRNGLTDEKPAILQYWEEQNKNRGEANIQFVQCVDRASLRQTFVIHDPCKETSTREHEPIITIGNRLLTSDSYTMSVHTITLLDKEAKDED